MATNCCTASGEASGSAGAEACSKTLRTAVQCAKQKTWNVTARSPCGNRRESHIDCVTTFTDAFNCSLVRVLTQFACAEEQTTHNEIGL